MKNAGNTDDLALVPNTQAQTGSLLDSLEQVTGSIVFHAFKKEGTISILSS